jgi:predicted  nucleic acid-binding Zn-ribbon protein
MNPICSHCGYRFPEDESRVACPNCGSTARTFHQSIEASVHLDVSLGLRQRRPGFAGWLVKITNRIKQSFGGLPARETLVIDRSHPGKTVKTHHVEERQADGSWKSIHDERVEWKAKTPRK